MNTEQKRADFEAWYADPNNNGTAWEAWQARAALQSQTQPKDMMLAGVLRMPFEMAMADPLSRMQYYKRAQQALNELEALQSQDSEGWKEAAIAWEVCASLHREHCKGKDPFYKTKQADFVKHAEDSRLKALSQPISKDKADAERYRWLRDSGGLHDLPYEDHGLGPEFPSGEALDAAIDRARRAEGNGE